MRPTAVSSSSTGRSSRHGRAFTVSVGLIVTTLVALAAVAWWAHVQGYISLTGESCSDEGYYPTPTYEELRTEHGKSAYCARQYVDDG